jgi:tetratricopeptide (TPR) repeat protein
MNAAIRLAIALGCGALVASHTSAVRAEQGSASTASADTGAADLTTEAARVHFQTGVDYYRDGDFEGARAEFERAHERAPNYKLLYNLGQLSVQLHDYVAAQRYFRQYLEQGGDEIEPARTAEVGSELVKLQRRVGSLTLTSNAANATFTLDGTAVQTDPSGGAVIVSTGRHTVTARAPGREATTRVVDVIGNDSLLVRIELPMTKARPPSAPEATGGSDAALWWGAGTGALAMGAGVMAYLTSRDVRAYNAELAMPTTPERLDELRQQAKTKALVTDILIGATLAAAVTTLVIAVTDGDSERAASASQQPRAELRVGLGSLQLAGRF